MSSGSKPSDGATLVTPFPIPESATVAAPIVPTGAPPPMPGDDDPDDKVVIKSSMPTLAGGQLHDVGAPPSLSPTRYQLADEIARGGMGRVVEAVDTVLGRVVALKEALALDPDAVRRFQRETKITARLEHPSIVPVHDAGTMPGGAPYYVMRKIGGRPLENLVAATKTVQERLAFIPHLINAANAVAHAHVRGIVHRDIKPSNILVGDLGETMVIDWGLAKVIGEADDIVHDIGPQAAPDDLVKTRAGIVYGTPGFMAPEQLCGFPVDERCDVYALGATLYHVLSMKPPHHAKTADAMMRAAVEGPPEPIRDLVPGVPPELATIVDKALATDANLRYQDARALAEDLQRFLTGQLIAAHHYTRREKLARFFKKYKTPVIVVAVATLVLLVGGVLAVTRIVRERDRADDAAQRAIARADQIALDQAKILVQSNPTLAVALLHPLVDKKWRDVRDIAASARAAGIAYALPASPHTPSLDFAHDGTHVLVAGDDGVVRILDLPAHTAKIIAERRAPAGARYGGDDDRFIVIWNGNKLAVLDDSAQPPAHRELEPPAAIADLEVAGTVAYWTDADKKLWHLDLAAGPSAQPAEVPLEEGATGVSASPDGGFLAVATTQHLLMIARAKTEEPAELALGEVRDAAWSPDGKHFVAVVHDPSDVSADRVIGMATDRFAIDNRLTTGPRLGVAYTDRTYTMGELGVSSLIDSTATTRQQLAGGRLGLRGARGGTLVAATATNTLHVIAATGDHVIAIPLPNMEELAASPRSAYIVGSFPGRLLVWNLDDIQPKTLVAGDVAPAFVGFAGNGRALAAPVRGTAQWLDIAGGKLTADTLDVPNGVRALAAAPDGGHMIVVDALGHGRALVFGQPPREIPDFTIAHAGFYDATHALVGSPSSLATYDAAANTLAPIASAPAGQIVQIAWTRDGSGWVAAVIGTANNGASLWRHSNATTATTIALPARPTTPPTILADGTVLVGIGRALWRWKPAGELGKLGELGKPIADLAPNTDPGSALAFDTDGFLTGVDVATGKLSQAYPLGSSAAAMAAEAGLLVARGRGGGIDMLDPQTHATWSLGEGGANFGAPKIAPDGRHVLVVATEGTRATGEERTGLPSAFVVMFANELPTDAAATAAWLDRLTNAQVADDNTLTWR